MATMTSCDGAARSFHIPTGKELSKTKRFLNERQNVRTTVLDSTSFIFVPKVDTDCRYQSRNL